VFESIHSFAEDLHAIAELDDKEVDWRGSSKKDLLEMPEGVRQTFGFAIGCAQNSIPYEEAKPLEGFKPLLVELLEDDDGDTYRAVYTAHYEASYTFCTASRRSLPKAASCRNGTRKPSRRDSRR
jgi:phage-related protein